MEAGAESDVRCMDRSWVCFPLSRIVLLSPEIGDDVTACGVARDVYDFGVQLDSLVEVEVLGVSPQVIHVFLDKLYEYIESLKSDRYSDFEG